MMITLQLLKSLLEKDKSVSIHHRNIHRVAIEMYKVINNLSPGIIQDLFRKEIFLH